MHGLITNKLKKNNKNKYIDKIQSLMKKKSFN